MSYDSDDMIEKRKRRSKLRSLRNLLIFLLIVGFCGYLYIQRDAWIPKLEGIGGRYDSVTQNDGTLAEGNFPLTISGSSSYQAALADDTLFLLHDAYLSTYSMHGDAGDNRQHAFQNATMNTAGKYVLLFESGGTSFRLDTRHKNVYGKSVDNNILSGVVSDNGTVALITESGSYACAIVVYDNTGKRLYQRNCTEYVVDLAFHKDSNGLCLTSVKVENGVVQSTVTSITFNQVDTQWTSMPLETLSVKSGFSSNDKFCVVGNTACAYYSSAGEMQGTYNYNGTLVSADLENGKAALIIQDDQKRNTSLVLLNQSVSSPKVLSIDSTAEEVRVCDGDAIVMSRGNITSYDFSGTALATVNLDGAYTSFLKQDGYLFLLGYDQIDRVDFKE